MPLDFPDSPTVGDIYEHWRWNGSQWIIITAASGNVTVAVLPPTNPGAGDLWWDIVGAQLYIWTGAEWVITVNNGGGGGDFLPIAGGTLTGNLSGPNAHFAVATINTPTLVGNTKLGTAAGFMFSYNNADDQTRIWAGGASYLLFETSGDLVIANTGVAAAGDPNNFGALGGWRFGADTSLTGPTLLLTSQWSISNVGGGLYSAYFLNNDTAALRFFRNTVLEITFETWNFYANGGVHWGSRVQPDDLFINYRAGFAGYGPYADWSDARIKMNIEPERKGLETILKLQPRHFQYGVQPRVGQSGLGFVADEVREVLPEAVQVLGILLPDGSGGLDSDSPTLGITDSVIVAVLVNAVKELAGEVRKLKNGNGSTGKGGK